MIKENNYNYLDMDVLQIVYIRSDWTNAENEAGYLIKGRRA